MEKRQEVHLVARPISQYKDKCSQELWRGLYHTEALRAGNKGLHQSIWGCYLQELSTHGTSIAVGPPIRTTDWIILPCTSESPILHIGPKVTAQILKRRERRWHTEACNTKPGKGWSHRNSCVNLCHLRLSTELFSFLFAHSKNSYSCARTQWGSLSLLSTCPQCPRC